MAGTKELPLCACGCKRHVRQRRYRFATAECAQRKARKQIAAPPSSTEVEGDTTKITRPATKEIKTLEDLIEVCEVDTESFEVERWTCNKWDGPTTEGTEPFYQVKATLKRRVAVLAVKAEIEALKEEAKSVIAPRAFPKLKATASGRMLEVSIPDLHVGKMAWANETGWEHYDHKIAQRVYWDALKALIQRTKHLGPFERIVLPIGNDLLHIDSRVPTTTSGTPQDTDSRYYKLFTEVRRMVTNAIVDLRQLAPVHVIMVPGNHDSLSMWHLGDSLECLFHNTGDVTIENQPTQRKYHQFGKVMLLFTHGSSGKLPDYPLVMATEQPVMFGETEFREAHTGHRHQVKLEEYHGVKVRISPALCSPDAWHSENCYVGNGRSAEAFVWSADEGLIAMAHYTVPSARDADDHRTKPSAISQAA